MPHGGQNRTHGHIRKINGKRIASPTYRSWQMMKARVKNPARHGYKIALTMDPTWSVFSKFLEDMGERPSLELTLERKDNSLGYSKSNCTWASRAAQARNRPYVKLDPSKVFEIQARYATGKFKQTDLAKLYGVCQRTISLVVRKETWAA